MQHMTSRRTTFRTLFVSNRLEIFLLSIVPYRPLRVALGRCDVGNVKCAASFGVCRLRRLLVAPVLPVLLSQNADVILPDYNEFTGFVFKLQANLDPRHRDRLAYIRVVSGRFEKGMKVKHILLQDISAGQPNTVLVIVANLPCVEAERIRDRNHARVIFLWPSHHRASNSVLKCRP